LARGDRCCLDGGVDSRCLHRADEEIPVFCLAISIPGIEVGRKWLSRLRSILTVVANAEGFGTEEPLLTVVVAFSLAMTDPVGLAVVARERPGARSKVLQLESFIAGGGRSDKRDQLKLLARSPAEEAPGLYIYCKYKKGMSHKWRGRAIPSLFPSSVTSRDFQFVVSRGRRSRSPQGLDAG
jgi:hypothetical protein